MKTGFVTRLAIGLSAVAVPGMALAQDAWTPGVEIVGQPLQVTTNGITNTVYLDPGGAARLLTPEGTTMPATWSAASGQLCLNNGSAQECWPYNGPFQANQPMTLTSSCNATSTWLAQAINQPPQPQVSPERGR